MINGSKEKNMYVNRKNKNETIALVMVMTFMTIIYSLSKILG